jgi:hypothetical protein
VFLFHDSFFSIEAEVGVCLDFINVFLKVDAVTASIIESFDFELWVSD